MPNSATRNSATNDSRIILTLDAGGSSFRFSAIQAAKPAASTLTTPSHGDNLSLCLETLVKGFSAIAENLPHPPSAISFAFPGPADYRQGIIGDLVNLPAFRGGVALGPYLQRKFKIPVFINNDGDLFTYGEAIAGFLPFVNSLLEKAGSPKLYKNLFGITFGTGFGAGLVRDRKMFLGDNICAAEIWNFRNKIHTKMNAEEGVSIRALKRVYSEKSGLPFESCPEPKALFEIAEGKREGNSDAAKRAFAELGEIAGDALAHALNLVDGLAVIGGGISKAHPAFMPTLIKELNSNFENFKGEQHRRLDQRAYNLEDPMELEKFLKGHHRTIKIPESNETLIYDDEPRVGIGISRLGTSEAVAIGAYAYALHQLDLGGERFMKNIFLSLLLISVFATSKDFEKSSPFVKVANGEFILNGKPYTFLGTNFWYGPNLASKGPGGNRARLVRELDRLAELGVKNLRIMAASEGEAGQPYQLHPSLQPKPGQFNKDLLEGLDFLLFEMSKRKMVGVLMLNNFWTWSGGMAQYMKWVGAGNIPYPPPAPKGNWDNYMNYVAAFYSNKEARAIYNNLIRTLVLRKNTFSGLLYKDDPTIMSWQLCNEPRGMRNQEAYNEWINTTTTFIRSLAPNHLISIGSEGDTSNAAYAGIDFIKNHSYANVDCTTAHFWIENWGWYDPKNSKLTYWFGVKKAKDYIKTHVEYSKKLRKPIVFEEFGLARDERSYDFRSPTVVRDRYYNEVFQEVHSFMKSAPVSGTSFWAWGGEGRAENPGSMWKVGNSWLGDPPHENQGWYSVYDTDVSTLKLIKDWAKQINSLSF